MQWCRSSGLNLVRPPRCSLSDLGDTDLELERSFARPRMPVEMLAEPNPKDDFRSTYHFRSPLVNVPRLTLRDLDLDCQLLDQTVPTLDICLMSFLWFLSATQRITTHSPLPGNSRSPSLAGWSRPL